MIFPSPLKLFWFSKLAGSAICIRSGVTDLLSFSCNLKLSVLHNEVDFEKYKDFRYGNNKRMFCASIKEFVISQALDPQMLKTIVDSVTC